MLQKIILLLLFGCVSTAIFAVEAKTEIESVCYGSTKQGHIEHAVELPASGNNFVSYSSLAAVLGRTYVHSKVRDIIISAYKKLETVLPDTQFKYAETGFKQGGKFSPHKTHQNGLSVDFMVPVLNKQNESVHLSTHALNRYGYDIEFDKKGRYQDVRIDFEALAAHIVYLDKEARAKKVKLWRVIFDPKLQPFLLATKHGAYIKKNITLLKKRSWVRHDEHYHVDFDIPCKR